MITRVFASSLLFLGACSLMLSQEEDKESPIQSRELTIETDAREYAPTDTVTVTFANGTDGDLVLRSDGCSTFDGKPLPELRLDKEVEDSWENVTFHVCAAIPQPAAQIESGEAYSVRFQVGIVNEPLEPGTYRYSFDLRHVTAKGEPGEQLAQEHRLSNTFEVVDQ